MLFAHSRSVARACFCTSIVHKLLPAPTRGTFAAAWKLPSVAMSSEGGGLGRLGFIGGGMMASAMVNGLVASKVAQPTDITVSDLYQPSLDRLAACGVNTTTSNQDVIGASDAIVIAVKPDVVPAVLEEIWEMANTEPPKGPVPLVISIAAGIPIAKLEELLPAGTRVVRVMPNTPCQVSEAAAAFAAGAHATDDDKALVAKLMGSVGYVCEVKEKQLDAVTGLSGSGPAYIFLLIEALADGGVRAGLPRAVALKLAAQTVRGAATMVLETGRHPGELKDGVCSPGGTTIAGVEALEKGGYRAAAMAAVAAATARSEELGKGSK